jgi:hypothetical protein
MHARYAKNRINSMRPQRSNNGLPAREIWHVKDSFCACANQCFLSESVTQGNGVVQIIHVGSSVMLQKAILPVILSEAKNQRI